MIVGWADDIAAWLRPGGYRVDCGECGFEWDCVLMGFCAWQWFTQMRGTSVLIICDLDDTDMDVGQG